MTDPKTSDADRETSDPELLWKLIRNTRFAMFTTRHADNGHLHSRPMTTQNKDEDRGDSLWFFMSRKSDPVDDFDQEPAVNVAYADPGADSYVSVSGQAGVVEDQATRERLWTPMSQAWFPGGPTDPDLALVRVRIVHANYWNVKESKVVQALKMAKAAVSGETPKMGEHGEVRMN
jgi:general stress protein 26